MKTKIRRVVYYLKQEKTDREYYTWHETCDRCGNMMGWEVSSLNEPNVDENDLCYKCLKHLLDNNLRFQNGKDVEFKYYTV